MLISEYTGGFTDLMKGRIAVPANGSYSNLRHVVRHEMVHAFMLEKLHQVMDNRGKYSYNRAGVNWRAIGALVVAIAPCVPGFLDAATGGKVAAPQFFKTLYTYAWFITFAIGFVLYGVMMMGHPNLPTKLTREETYENAANR